MVKPNSFETLVAALQGEFKMLVFQNALLLYLKEVRKNRSREAGTPYLPLQHAGNLGVGITGFQRTISFYFWLKPGFTRQCTHGVIECILEIVKTRFAQG